MDNRESNKPKVSIIVINWNRLEDSIECLESLKKIEYSNYDVILVDNGSSGNDAHVLNSRFGNYIFLIKNDRNYGFAGGVNIAIKHALTNFRPDYILSLNNDTIVDSQFLNRLVETMETDTTIGIAGPKIYYYDYPGYIQTIGERLSMVKGQTSSIGIGEEDQGQYNKIRDVDYVSVCLLIRTAVIRNIGLIDEGYFCYWEDVDYCLRTRKAGYKVIYVPESKIWHKKYMKKKILDKSSEGMISDSVLYYSIRNCFKFMREHANKHQYLVFLFFFFGYYFWHMVADILLFRRYPKRFTVFCSGIKDGLFGKGGSRD